MQKQNIPIASKSCPIDVKTLIPADNLQDFEEFLDLYNLDKIRVGFYEYKIPNTTDLGMEPQNCIVYEIPGDEETRMELMKITLKHNSLEKLYGDYFISNLFGEIV